MDIYQKIISLKLPRNKYVIGSGSALEGYGIRKSGDIDMAVTKDVYSDLKRKGWKETEKPNGKKVLEKNKFEVSINFHYGNYKTSTQKLIKTATVIRGVPFANLKETIALKKELNRDKDIKDIKLIEKYLQSQT